VNKIILPSIIATSQQELDTRIDKMKQHFTTLHLDIMEFRTVGNRSLDFDFLLPHLQFEAHLMVEHPEEWVLRYLEKYPNIETFFVHIESLETPHALIQLVQNHGKKIGFVLNPETSLDEVIPFLDIIDYVLFMTVVPGQYNAAFVPRVVEKIAVLHGMKPHMGIQVDGSVNSETIGSLLSAGVTRFVVGSYLQKADDLARSVELLTKHF
jgi:ribulose-phosphate 3-epimerase